MNIAESQSEKKFLMKLTPKAFEKVCKVQFDHLQQTKKNLPMVQAINQILENYDV